MTVPEIRKARFIVPEGIDISPRGLAINVKLRFEEWSHLWESLKTMHGSVLFWVGDVLNWGEGAYGERYAQVIDATDYNPDTLRAAKWVSERIPLARRRALSWSHHREVAPFEPTDQNKWLDKAEANGWRSRELRSHIRAAKNGPAEPADSAQERVMISDVLFLAVEDIRSIEKELPELYGRWKQQIDAVVNAMEHLQVALDRAEKE